MQKLQEVFNVFAETDADELSPEYLGSVLRATGHVISDESLKEVLAGENETLSFNRVLQIAEQIKPAIIEKKDLVAAFEMFDAEKTGKLPVGVLKKILETGENPLEQEEIDACIEILNPDPEGAIDYVEKIKEI